MIGKIIDHAYIISAIVLAVYSQLIIRWQVPMAGELPKDLVNKLYFIGYLLINPWIISSMAATFIAGVLWMLVMTRFEISYAYPWMSLIFLLMLIFGVLLFNEHFSVAKLIGTLLIMCGIIVIVKS